MKKVESYQGLRAIAFFGIFLSHSKIKYFSSTGHLGVSIFLILSGFLMMNSYYNKSRITNISLKDNLSFSIQKIRKLYRLHILMMLTAIPRMIHTYISSSANHVIIRSIINLFANIFLVQSWIPKEKIYYSLNGVAWYLSVCVFLYFMFPFILNYIEEKYNKKKAIICSVFVFVLQILVGFISSKLPLPWSIRWDFPTWVSYISPITRLGDFIIGCNLGYLFLTQKKESSDSKITTVLLEIFGIFLSIGACFVFYSVSNKTNVPAEKWWINTSIFLIPAIILVYITACNDNMISHILSNKVLVHIGNISSGLFLIHQMIFKYFESIYVQLTKKDYYAKWYFILAVFAISVVIAEIYDVLNKKHKLIKKDPH